MRNEIKKIKKEIKVLKFILKFTLSRKKRLKLKEKILKKQRIVEYKNLINEGHVGEHTYIATNYMINKEFVKIGKFCSIARETIFGLGNHPTHLLTSHPIAYSSNEFIPFFVDIKTPKDKFIKYDCVENIMIGNDVWVGQRAIILDGVTIGDGAVIGAGAIVTKDIPPYAIAVGVPAKVVKYRFSPEIIEKLLELKWWDYPKDFIVNELPFDNIEKCIEILEANKHLRFIKNREEGGKNHL